MMNQDFLEQLQQQAQKQAVLHEKRVFPRQLDWLTSLVGNYPWQILLVVSLLTALVIEFV